MTKSQIRHVLEPDCNDSKGDATSNRSASLSILLRSEANIKELSAYLQQHVQQHVQQQVLFGIPTPHNHKLF